MRVVLRKLSVLSRVLGSKDLMSVVGCTGLLCMLPAWSYWSVATLASLPSSARAQ